MTEGTFEKRNLSIFLPIKVATERQNLRKNRRKVGGVDKTLKKCYISFVTYL